MATFEAQVSGLTGLTATFSGSTNPQDTEVDQFLKDGVIEVTNRIIELRPQDIVNFSRESTEQTSNESLDLNGAKIISVVREADVNNDWRDCRAILPSMQSRVVDSDSLYFASVYNPVYTILEQGQISVFPTPDTGGSKSFKVFYVNNVPQDKGGAALLHSHSDIGYFMDDRVYLVVLYASIASLEAKLGEYTIDEEDIELVQALVNNINNLKQQYETAFLAMAPPQQQQAQGPR